ncbi:MAG: phosphatase PAP2 family protein [Desulfovibrio sp.]|nr:phosphatase PAP2 family protein [Desulfovibrio sp.]
MRRAQFASCIFFFALLCLPFSTVLAKDVKGQEKVRAEHFDLGKLDESVSLPKPPDSESLLFRHDKHCYEQGMAMRNTERAHQAARDADTRILPEYFSEAFGAPISKDTMPELYRLIQRVRRTLGKGVREFKKIHWRKRPYVHYGDATCFREAEESHRETSSYPSGHSTRAWGVALLLSEINPARAELILQRGKEYGQSRVICGYHWQSDVDAGRLLATALMAKLFANPEFMAHLEKAKAEYAAFLSNQSEGK